MPFTFSHPAIILPLCGKRNRLFSVTGLIVGSIVLDFEFLIEMRALHHDSQHSFRGIFVFGLPVGLLLSLVFHLIVRDQLIDHLPPVLYKRMVRFRGTDWADYLRRHPYRVLVSLIVGMLSHLFLDAFTHEYGFFVHSFSLLQRNLYIGHKVLPLYFLLQLFFSLVGAMVVVISLFRLPPVTNVIQSTTLSSRISYWWRLAVLFGLIMVIRRLLDPADITGDDLMIALTAAAVFALFLLSLGRLIHPLIRSERSRFP